jgi:hypothetical protein
MEGIALAVHAVVQYKQQSEKKKRTVIKELRMN